MMFIAIRREQLSLLQQEIIAVEQALETIERQGHETDLSKGVQTLKQTFQLEV